MTSGGETDLLESRIRALEEENARLRLELWEWRDAAMGQEANERSLEYLIHENQRLRYLLRRPWRVAQLASTKYVEKARRRAAGLRSANS